MKLARVVVLSANAGVPIKNTSKAASITPPPPMVTKDNLILFLEMTAHVNAPVPIPIVNMTFNSVIN